MEGHSIAMHNHVRYCISCQAALCYQRNTAESAAVALLKTDSKNYHNSFIEPVNRSLWGKSTATSWGPSSSCGGSNLPVLPCRHGRELPFSSCLRFPLLISSKQSKGAVRSTASRKRRLWFKFWLCHMLTTRTWLCYLYFLRLSFLICK